MKALFFECFGGPDVLRYGELPDPVPKPGHAIVRTEAIGLNFADVYRRRGNYHLAGTPPYVAGYEAAGRIVASEGLLAAGTRVAFADAPHANAELVSVPVDNLIPLPGDISFETAAAVLLQGLTAHYLVRDSYAVRAGDVAVVHAAAGGVGLLLTQMLVHAGARVIAFASTQEKCAAARAYGASEAYAYADGWPARAKDADVVYDSVGSTLDVSIAAVRVRGTVVFYGFAGGDPKPVDPRALMDGSKRLVGGDLWNVLGSHQERVARANELFALVAAGALRVPIAARFALNEGVKAHEFLESRAAIGKVLLIP
jgi:NADPH2:quinone reductase